jgi:hypothetical protein
VSCLKKHLTPGPPTGNDTGKQRGIRESAPHFAPVESTNGGKEEQIGGWFFTADSHSVVKQYGLVQFETGKRPGVSLQKHQDAIEFRNAFPAIESGFSRFHEDFDAEGRKVFLRRGSLLDAKASLTLQFFKQQVKGGVKGAARAGNHRHRVYTGKDGMVTYDLKQFISIESSIGKFHHTTEKTEETE